VPDGAGFIHVNSSHVIEVLDGRNRLEAMERAGIELKPRDDLNMLDLEEHEIVAHIISANIRRRHLTKQQQADLIVAAHKAAAEAPRQLGEVPNSASSRNLPAQGKRHVKGKAGSEKDQVKAAAVATAKKHGISKRTVERAMAKAEGKEPKTDESKPTYRAPLRRKPKLVTSSPLEAARHYYLEQCAAETGLDIDVEIDTIADALRELGKRSSPKTNGAGKATIDTPLSNIPSTPNGARKRH
jgi:hypothetical protein